MVRRFRQKPVGMAFVEAINAHDFGGLTNHPSNASAMAGLQIPLQLSEPCKQF